MTTRTKDGKEVVEDGETVKINMMLMDGVQRAVAGDGVLADAVGHRPGSLPMTDAEREHRTTLYSDHDKRLSERWRTPQPTANTTDARHSTSDARLDAYANYQERIANAWRHQ